MVRQGHTKIALMSSDFRIDEPMHLIAGIQEALAAANINLPLS